MLAASAEGRVSAVGELVYQEWLRCWLAMAEILPAAGSSTSAPYIQLEVACAPFRSHRPKMAERNMEAHYMLIVTTY